MAHEAGQPAVHHIDEGLERRLRLCHQRCMATRTPTAGGFLLTSAIIAGGVAGIFLGNPMKGVVIGTVAGVAIAVAVWLLDRRARS